MKQTLKLSFLSLFFVSLFSCGSIQKKKEVEILKPASLSFVELAPFFPKDTFAVGRIRIDKFAHDWFPAFSEETSDVEMNKLMAQRNQDFRKHIEQESIKAFGIDILKAKEIVFAIGSKGPVLAIQGDQNAVAPKFSKINELAHTRVIGNTILAYPKDDAESLIADEGIDPEKLKSIPGNSLSFYTYSI